VKAETSFNKARPAWRLASLEMVDKWGWHSLDTEKLKDIHAKLSGFESMTWNEILVNAKKQNHSVQVSNLSNEAKSRLQIIKQDDVDELVSLRVSGKERIWGIRENEVLNILWWDPDHEVCPSLKNNN
jgi:hypothetical protein